MYCSTSSRKRVRRFKILALACKVYYSESKNSKDVRVKSLIFLNSTLVSKILLRKCESKKLDSPQVKQYLIFSINSIVYELPHEFAKQLNFVNFRRWASLGVHTQKRSRILVNIRKLSKLGGDRAYCPAFLPEIKLFSSSQKLGRSNYQIFFAPVQFCVIFLACVTYFV